MQVTMIQKILHFQLNIVLIGLTVLLVCQGVCGGETKPRVIRVKSVKPTELTLSWAAPLGSTAEVKGYTIHISEVSEEGATLDIQIDEVSPNNKESHVVRDLTPGTTYQIQVSAKYPDGFDDVNLINGPRSEALMVPTPGVRPQGSELSLGAVALSPETVLVTYEVLGGATVSDLSLSSAEQSPDTWGSIPVDTEEQLATVTGLKPSTKYFFKLKATVDGKKKDLIAHVQTLPLAPDADADQQPDACPTLPSSPASLFSPTSPPCACTTTTSDTEDKSENSRDISDSRYLLTLHAVQTTESTITVLWFVTKGDLKNVQSFGFQLKSTRGKKLLDEKLKKMNRILKLRKLAPGTDYTITVTANDASGGLLGEQNLSVKTLRTEAESVSSSPQVILYADEIRSNQLRLGWELKDVDPSMVKRIRLRVYNRQKGGQQMLSRDLPPDTRTFFFPRLPPNRRLYVTVEVIGPENNKPVVISGVNLVTAAPGGEREPVQASPTSLLTGAQHTTTTTSTTTTATAATTFTASDTAGATTLTQTTTTTESTTTSTLPTTTTTETTTTPTTPPTTPTERTTTTTSTTTTTPTPTITTTTEATTKPVEPTIKLSIVKRSGSDIRLMWTLENVEVHDGLAVRMLIKQQSRYGRTVVDRDFSPTDGQVDIAIPDFYKVYVQVDVFETATGFSHLHLSTLYEKNPRSGTVHYESTEQGREPVPFKSFETVFVRTSSTRNSIEVEFRELNPGRSGKEAKYGAVVYYAKFANHMLGKWRTEQIPPGVFAYTVTGLQGNSKYKMTVALKDKDGNTSKYFNHVMLSTK